MTDSAAYRRRNKLKTAFKVCRDVRPIYSGGKVVLSTDGLHLYSCLDDVVVGTHTATGEELCRIEGDSSVTSLALTPFSSAENAHLLIARRSFGLHFCSVPDGQEYKLVARAHDAPIITTSADPTGSLFATGSSDGIIKVWDARAGHCTHVFKGHGGVISAFAWDLSSRAQPRLISAADDCRIRIWSLTDRKCLDVLEGHSSVVRGLAVTEDGRTLVSGGRDRLVNVWSIAAGSPSKLKAAISVSETLESCGLVKGKGKAKQQSVYTGGDRGHIRLWSLETGKATAEASTSQLKAPEITDVIYLATEDCLVSVHVDHNIIFHDVPSLNATKQVVGYNDEVIDCVFLSTNGGEEDTLAVATNSEQIRLYDLGPDGYSNTRLLSGHNDVALCLARSATGDMLMSGSKDHTARIWQLNSKGAWACQGVCTGHLESVGAVALSKLSNAFAVTASQDKTVKIWDLTDPKHPSSLLTQKMHEKDINAIDVAPNDKFLVTGSQDKTAKLFAMEVSNGSATLQLRGTFQGHKRGVWSVKFGSHDQVVATASGDKTVKLWDMNTFACLKTFEGHTNSVLRLEFMTQGLQLVSCASDGLVKVWNIKDEESAATLDNHEEKIWALAISKDEKTIVSGAADSVITIWQDVTKEQEEERLAEQQQTVIQNQDYENFVASQDYKSAILLALSMDNPRRLLALFTSIARSDSKDPGSATGSAAVDLALTSLLPQDLLRLLAHVRDWNTSIKTSDAAQSILHVLLQHYPASHLLALSSHPPEAPKDTLFTDAVVKSRKKTSAAVADILEGLLPYTERHYRRADRMQMQDAWLVDYSLSQMDLILDGPDTRMLVDR